MLSASQSWQPRELPGSEAELAARMAAHLELTASLMPPLSSAALEALARTRELDVAPGRVVEALEHDAALASRVLTISRARRFELPVPPVALDEVVVRMGVVSLRWVVLEAALHQHPFRLGRYPEMAEPLRRHGSLVAHLAYEVGRLAGLDGERAFQVGLMHHVGIARALLALDVASGDAEEGARLALVPEVWLAVESVHATAAGSVARVWGLPPEVQMALDDHHETAPSPLGAVLALAEVLAQEAGYGLGPALATTPAGLALMRSGGFTDTNVMQPWLRALGLKHWQLDVLRTTASRVAGRNG